MSAVFLLWGGCERPGPIEVIDETAQQGDVEVINTVPPTNLLFDDNAADSAGIVQTVPRRVYAELLLADAATDRDTGVEKSTLLARAIFYSKNDTFRVNGFVGMRSLPAGVVTLDGVRLRIVDARVAMPTQPARDTMVGVRYQLLSHHDEGFGMAGFTYEGRRSYRWVVSGSPVFPPFQAEIAAPPRLRVTSPAPDENVSRQNDLHVQWQGGGDSVRGYFAEPRGGGGLRVMMHFRVRKNDGAVVIPAAMLKLLPADRNKVVLVLTSEANKMITIAGYPDNVFVRALTTHNVTVRLRH